VSDAWIPYRPIPGDLTRPVRIDPSGLTGPTRGQARGRSWRACGGGWYVPATVSADRTEQRILETGTRLRQYEALAGWASLRWHGAGFFDGQLASGVLRPLPVIRRSGARHDPLGLVVHWRHQLAPHDTCMVGGLRCSTVARSLFDEARYASSLREAVVAVDMAVAAGLCTLTGFGEYVEQHPHWWGVRVVRKALELAAAGSRSPQESRLRLVWLLDARLPPPRCNPPVFDRHGQLLGVPDLLDADVGLVVEYDGAHHRAQDRHRRDVAREHRFREAGLEYAAVVGGDLAQRGLVVDRLVAAYRRAAARPPATRGWTLTPPPWWSSEAA
jgi:hypothetical protein